VYQQQATKMVMAIQTTRIHNQRIHVYGVQEVLANTTTAWRTADCDGDGVTNYDEATGTDGNPLTTSDNTNPLSACSLNLGQVTLVATSTGDCDGDGVTNKDEINGIDDNPLTLGDNTNPNDGCSYNKVDQVIGNVSVMENLRL
jgi:hypothetical protein